MKITKTLILSSALAISVGSLSAQVTENFSYADGPLAGQNGGAGWSAGWTDSFTRNDSGFTVAGGKAFSPGDGTRHERALANPFDSGVVYLGFEIQVPNTDDDPFAAIEFRNGANRIFSIGLLKSDDGTTDTNFFLRTQEGTEVEGGATVAIGEIGTYNIELNQIVTRIDFENNTVTAFFNPAAGVDFVTGEGDVSADLQDGVSITGISLANFGNQGGAPSSVTFDSLSLGVDPPVFPVEDGTLRLNIASSGDDLVFQWNSKPSRTYTLRASTTLDTVPNTWTAIATDLTTNTLTQPRPADAKTFYVVEEAIDPVLLSEDFELSDGDFTVVTTSGTAWELGVPDSSSNLGGTVAGGSEGAGTRAWGTNLGDQSETPVNEGFHQANTNSSLISPAIDLTDITAANLTFSEALDLDTNDTVTVNILNAADDSILEANVYTTTDTNTSSADWTDIGPIAIPAAALGQQIKIEFRIEAVGGSNTDFFGWYIDQIEVLAE